MSLSELSAAHFLSVSLFNGPSRACLYVHMYSRIHNLSLSPCSTPFIALLPSPPRIFSLFHPLCPIPGAACFRCFRSCWENLCPWPGVTACIKIDHSTLRLHWIEYLLAIKSLLSLPPSAVIRNRGILSFTYAFYEAITRYTVFSLLTPNAEPLMSLWSIRKMLEYVMLVHAKSLLLPWERWYWKNMENNITKWQKYQWVYIEKMQIHNRNWPFLLQPFNFLIV